VSRLTRLSLSMEEPLLARLEKLVRKSGYANRSEFIRDMIRERLVAEEWEADRETVGTITLLYDHHRRGLGRKLVGLQHHRHDEVLATTHVHLDEDICVEAIIMKGRAGEIRKLADGLRRQKGVLHAALALSSTGKGLG